MLDRSTRGTEAASAARSPGRNALLLLAIVLALIWFAGLDHRKLIKPDEGRYAEIPREMVATGDWLTPRLNDLKYFEKPPLQYWTTAAAYETFGISEWTSRLWTALTGFLGVFVVGYTAARLYDRRAGLYAATALASSLAYVLLAHFNTLDMGLAFFMSVTLCATLLARQACADAEEFHAADAHCGSPPDQARSRAARWMMVAWAAMALAVLSKGPVAVVLSGGALVLYLVVARDWALLKMLAPIRGLAILIVIAAPWFIAVSRANPEFAHFFFIHEHVERFTTTEHRREGPIWYFVPVLLAGLLPWISIACGAVVAAWRAPARERRSGFRPERLLLAWSLVIFVFFSVSGSKLPSYVLPIFPALALLIGRELARLPANVLKTHLIGIAALAAIAFVTAVFIERLIDSREDAAAIAAFRNAALASMLAWLAGSVVAVWLAARARVTAAIVAAGLAAALGWSSLLLGHEALGRGMSTYDLARSMQPWIEPNAQDATPIYSVGIFEHTLDFYLQRTVTLVSFRDELDFGLTQEPDKGIATLAEFGKRWSEDRAPLAVMDRDLFDKLTANRFPMRVVADDGRRIVIAKPAETIDPAPTPPRRAQ